jgi:8-oxo-dGTP pyrophosphatase MutT (NUDIX family)
MVRFGNVLSSSGSVIPRFQEQIRQGGPLTVTHPEITRYFMTIPEAVELVIQTAGLSKGGEVFLLDMGEPVKILDLALKMIRLSGMKPVLADLRPSSKLNNRSVDGITNSDIENAEKSSEVKSPAHTRGIEIVFTGLRPGEKLFEELLIDAAAERTEHPMIRRAKERFMTWDELGPMIETLSEICLQSDKQGLLAILEKFDIGYHTQSESSTGAQPSDARLVEDYRFGAGDSHHVKIQPVYASMHHTEVSIVSPPESVDDEKALIHPLLSKSLHLFFLLTRPLTLGARGIVLNDAREVLLVLHRYEQGWQLPGGGVEIGESPLDALRREVLEETGFEISSEPVLLGVYHNRDVSDRDHLLVYRCDHSRLATSKTLSGEIAVSGFFPIDDLPKGTTAGTKRRLAECFKGQALHENW